MDAVYKLVIGYDGTDFHGFQLQPGGVRTVQGELSVVLNKIYHREVSVTGASRTDAGVHARGQVVAFSAPDMIPAARLPLALNRLLPGDIVVSSACQVPADFHPQFDALGKVYTYTIDNNPFPRVLQRRYAWHYPRPLHMGALEEACGYLIGEHDFKAFQSAGSSAKTSVRNMKRLEMQREDNFLVFTLEANGFLYRMVRNLIGSLMIVGRGARPSAWIKEVLFSRDRSRAGPTAPARGLCLEVVYY